MRINFTYFKIRIFHIFQNITTETIQYTPQAMSYVYAILIILKRASTQLHDKDLSRKQSEFSFSI